MDTYYINLDKRTDRRAQMEQRFAELGLHARRISAVQPSDLTSAQKFQCERSLASSDPIVEVELCCNLSHKRAIEAFIASRALHAAFFEDDIAMADDLPELLIRVDREGMPCDILRLETYLDRCHYGLRQIRQFGRYAVHSMHGYTWGSAGYVMNRQAAEAYLRTPKMLGITTDRALWRRFPNATGMKALQLIPAPVAQLDRFECHLGEKSDIASQRWQAHKDHSNQERFASTLLRFCRDEFTIAAPSLIHRWLRLSTRGLVPFSGKHAPDA